ncbi:MAG: hypothetical protein M3Z00_09035 [Actinomycetota bacterium]|nr:hypothetical protein [Actinomycetota bacterium]
MNALVDAVESWLAGLSFWAQAPLLLIVLVPLCWLLAGGIDQIVERLLRRHTRGKRLGSIPAEQIRAVD